ncbi:retrovirus-related pol polyprotein from transposon TNT 1-94 [Tanacetum coccineum]
MVYQLTKFHVQRVDMVINPPWNLPFLGAKGLTSPEQTATVGYEHVAINLTHLGLSAATIGTTYRFRASQSRQHEPTLSIRPTNVEVPKELPKVSMVNTSLKKLKHHLANFDVVVKERTTPTAITEVDELSEVQNVFYQMEQAVEQHRIESKTFEVKMNQVLNENERLLEQVMSKDIVNLLVNPSMKNDSVNSQEKDTLIKKLKERIKSLSGNMDKDKIKQDLEEIETINIELDHRVTKLIAENEHLKLGLLKQTYDSIKPAREAAILRDLVDHIKANYPLDPLLESACNTKKDKIQQTQSRILKNKVEAHPRKVKSSLKNKDHVVEPKGTAPVQHSKLNANSDLKCVKCNGCMLYDNHDLCALDFINNVNARAKSRSVKKISKRKVWKPTGKVFTNIGYIWRPTGRTFTIVGNACPLTRITTTTEVPLRKSSALDNKTHKHVITLVYSRKPRKSKTSVHVNNYKTLREYYEKVGISHETSVARSPQQNGVVERRNRTLIEAARTMLIYAKAPLFLWAEAVATACYTQNRSMIRRRHGKTPYKLLHNKPPDLSFKGLVQPIPSTPFVPPSRTDWDMLFQPLFDEFLNPSPSVDHPAPEVVAPINEVIAPVLADSTGSPSSTTVDQKIQHLQITSEEGIDFEESFALVARLEAIRIFLAFACSYEHGRIPNGCEDCVSEWKLFMVEKLHGVVMICCLRSDIQGLSKGSPWDPTLFLKIPKASLLNQSKYALESFKEYYGFRLIVDPLVDTLMVEKSKWIGVKTGSRYQASLRKALKCAQFADWIMLVFSLQSFSTLVVCQLLGDRLVWLVRLKGRTSAAIIQYEDDIDCFVRLLCSLPLDEITVLRLWLWNPNQIYFIKEHVGEWGDRFYLSIREYQLETFSLMLLAVKELISDHKLWNAKFYAETQKQLTDEVDELVVVDPHGFEGYLKMVAESDEVLKLKNFKKDATLKLSKSTNQEWYEHVGPEVTRSQDDKVTRWQNEIMLG